MQPIRTRRDFLVGLGALTVALTACGTSKKSDSATDASAPGSSTGASTAGGASSGSDVLTTALSQALNPDPDQFFELEGVMITNSIYEGLVENPPQSIEVKGVLAESWEISVDGLTYTFKLKPNLTFTDGTPIDSAAMKASFERRTAAKGSPGYMLGEVAGYETPDASTFVIKLSQPVNNFLSRLASPWGPKATNPTILAEKDKAGDALGSTFLTTNSAGSGPYVISEYTTDQQVVLTRNEKYWGPKPFFRQVVFKFIDDKNAQRIQLEAGDLDFIQGVTPQAADKIKADGKLTVSQPSAFNMTFFQVNTTLAPFSKEVLAALPKALPYDTIVKGVFGSWATVAKQTITANRMPAQYASWNPGLDPSALKKAFDALPADQKSTPVVIGTFTTDNGVHARIADYTADVLTTAGFKVERRQYTSPDYFGMIGAPDKAPHLMLSTQPDDGVHPDHWYRIWMYTKGALNVGNAGSPEADALMDKANATPPGEEPPYELYAQAGKLVTDAGHFIPIADAPVIWVTKPDLAGATVRFASNQGLVIEALKRA